MTKEKSKEPESPTVLHVIMHDTERTINSVVHLNSWLPYGSRLVAIQLTEEQREALRPRQTGKWHEEIGQVWLEQCEGKDEKVSP